MHPASASHRAVLTHAQISAEAWQARLRAVIRKGSRYINPRFDVVWAAVSFMCVPCPRDIHRLTRPQLDDRVPHRDVLRRAERAPAEDQRHERRRLPRRVEPHLAGARHQLCRLHRDCPLSVGPDVVLQGLRTCPSPIPPVP